jgi:MFS superfamily sulfate permease-like transporter
MPWRFELAPAIRPYRRQWLRGDVLAGLAAGAVVIPQAMAYATVAGMPVQFGLYTCMLPLVVYAFIGVKLVPPVPQGLPIPGWPAFDHVAQLIPGALAIAMMAFLETVSTARGIRKSEDPQLDPDRELTASGLAAVLGSLFHTLPPSAGFSQSQVNSRSGARTQVSSLVTAALVAGLLPAVAIGVLLTLYAVLHEANHPHVVQVIRRDGSYWVDRAEGDPIEPADRWCCAPRWRSTPRICVPTRTWSTTW